VAGYNARQAFTEVVPKENHRSIDKGWRAEFQARGMSGEQELTARDLYDTVARSILASERLTDREKESHIARLSDELFIELKLDPEQKVRMPWRKER
jgi:hypothetical protein